MTAHLSSRTRFLPRQGPRPPATPGPHPDPARQSKLGALAIDAHFAFEEHPAHTKMQRTSDPAVHFDLAIAYREMGLFADAITELERAAEDPSRECACQAMIGRIQRQLGNANAAIDALARALSACTEAEEELALLYDLADAYLETGRREQARYFFRRLAKLQPGYQDPRGSVEARRSALGDSQPPDSIV